jgi:hypothetical protein
MRMVSTAACAGDPPGALVAVEVRITVPGVIQAVARTVSHKLDGGAALSRVGFETEGALMTFAADAATRSPLKQSANDTIVRSLVSPGACTPGATLKWSR